MKKWNSEIFGPKSTGELVEVFRLNDGELFEYQGLRYVKCKDLTSGTRSCIRLYEDGNVAIVPLDGYTKVLPLPYTSRLVIEPIENGGAE